MRILFITETVPHPLDSGGRIKTWHTLAALASEHELHCHAFARSAAQSAQALEPLRRMCRSVTIHVVARTAAREAAYVARSVATRLPYSVVRHFSGAALASMAASCRAHRIEATYCDHLSMLEYGRRLALPIVHDAHNVEYRIAQRHAASLGAGLVHLAVAREWRRLRAYERTWYPRCALIFAVSEEDATEIRRLSGGGPTIVAVPIGIDTRAVTVGPALTDRPVVLFVGGLDWPPNRDAVEHFLTACWPGIRQAVPNARFTVVGRSEGVLRRRWQASDVTFTGRVDDLTPHFAASRVTVVPIRSGSGMRVKILDAMARGVPVVATPVGAEGIAAAHGTHLLLGETPSAFTEHVVRVLGDRPLAERLARAARALVERQYDVQIIGTQQRAALAKLRQARLSA
jgi:glycosyltransferase involved in cell wall biosynthesis